MTSVLASHPRFEIVRALGQGGMGVVYEAIDRERGTRVALKTMQAPDATGLLRFKREFRAIADLVHPNLVPLYELVVDESACFFTMELVPGAVDLLRHVRGTAALPSPSASTVRARRSHAVTPSAPLAPEPLAGGVDLERLRGAFLQVVDGVEHIHRGGKLHRDLKPSNVLVRPDGRVVILDFGLVADLDAPAAAAEVPSQAGRVYETRSGSGTAQYMAPEQALGGVLGPACDWYAVGVMLFEALTGRLPFAGDALQQLVAKVESDAPRVRRFVPDVPDELDALVAALLCREPSARADAGAIRRALAGTDTPTMEVASTPFVGRSAQAEALERALDEACEGRSKLVRVRGTSGMGKSALVDHFLERHAASAWVLRGRCFEQETVPWKALDGIVDTLAGLLVRREGESRLALSLEGVDALARMFPVMAELVPAAEGDADPEALRERGVLALAALVGHLARERPVIAVLDDAQWGDAAGIQLIGRLLAHAPPMLFVASSRLEHEGRSEALERLQALEHTLGPERAARVDLVPLDDADARALARAIAPGLTDERVEAVVRDAAGNPFFVQELSRHGASASDARSGMDELIRARVESLETDARALIEACAVAARPLPLRWVERGAGIGSVGVGAALGLRRAGLVRGTGTGASDAIETFHDRVREAIVRGLSPDRARALHRGLARALAEAPEIEPEAVAAHHEAGGERALALPYWSRAAAAATQALAFERAELFHRRALSAAETSRDRVAAHEQLVHFLTNRGRFAEAYAEGRAALAGVGVTVPEAFSPPALIGSLARVAIHQRARDVSALRALPTATDSRAIDAVRLLGATMKAAFQVRPELCITLANESVDLCLRHGNAPECAVGWMAHGAIFRGGIVGQHAVGHAYGRLALDLVERFDCRAQRAEVRFVVGYFGTAWMRPFEEAEALFASALEAAVPIGDDFHAGCAIAGLAMSRTLRDAPAAAVHEVADRHRAFLVARRLLEPLATLDAAVALAGGEPPRVEDDATLARYGSRHFAHFQLLALALDAERRNDLGAARGALARAEKLASESTGMIQSSEHTFLRAVLSPSRRARLAEARRLRAWAADCPANYAPKAALASALALEGLAPRGRVRDAVSDVARAHEGTRVGAMAQRARERLS